MQNNNEYKGYLMVHFTGESEIGEQVYFAISEDGLFWKDLNDGKTILESTLGDKGVRDPFILRSVDGSKYYIIATDLRIANGKGWGDAVTNGSRSVIIWESEDLIHWSKERMVEVGIPEAGCVWAPEVIYDEERQEYLMFWASNVKEPGETEAKQRIYASTTRDFINFSKPVKYIERENHVIDTTIIRHKGFYYRFSKDETTKNIRCDRSMDLWGDFENVTLEEVEAIYGVEGPAAVYLNEREEWCLMVDRFAERKGYLPLVSKDLTPGSFRILEDSEFDLGKGKKRHGSLLNLTKEEYNRLWKTFGDKNPVLEGLYADPDMVKFGDTYYIYPTTDGFHGWSGTKFHVFSSKDMHQWKDEGVIVDVASEQVPWATGCAWAPAATYRNGKYYYYFCGKAQNGNSCIGVASSDSPVGPFVAEKEPMITIEQVKEAGIPMHQTIDPSVYIEEDGNYYLLFGNNAPAIAKLNDDMISIDWSTIHEYKGAFDFREAITVFKRNGLYHFTWSCDDTRSENYHINYGTSEQLYGPIKYHYAILEKEPDLNILGTGHHSICKTGEDEYVIAYHRFGTPTKKYPGEEGFHRETCLDQLEFGEDGLIKKVKVTK